MLLYVCPECGAWSDVTLAQAFQSIGRAFAKGLAEAYDRKMEGSPTESMNWPCPLHPEHGNMRAIRAEDRLFCKPARKETEQGGLHEQEEREKRQHLLTEIDRVVGRRLGLVHMSNLKRASTARLEAFLATVKGEYEQK